MLALLSLVALAQVYRTASALPGRIHEEDFADYYAAAIIMRQGLNPYRTSLAAVGPKLGLHSKAHAHDDIIPETPAFLLCLKALGALPLETAYWTWISINFVALILALYLLLGPTSGLRPADACLMTALALMYPPLINLFLTAQSQVLVVLGLTLSVRLLAKGRDISAGVMLAALAVLRGYPVLIGFYLLFRRRWTALFLMAAGGALGILTCASLMGWRAIFDFPLGLAAAGGDRKLFLVAWNTAPASFVWRVFFYLNGWKIGPEGDRLARALGYTTALIFFTLTSSITIRRARDGDRNWSLFALWVVTCIEVLPVSWLNYNVLLFIPFASIASAAVRSSVSQRTIWAAIGSYFLSLFAFGGTVFLTASTPSAFVVLVGESKSVAVMLGYLSAYWFAADET